MRLSCAAAAFVGRILAFKLQPRGTRAMTTPFVGLSFDARAFASILALAAFPNALTAQESWGGSITLTSDYRVRGLSKTLNDAAIQGGLQAQLTRGWLIGAWASSVSRDRGRSSALEVDAFTGYHWNLAPEWDAKVTATHYWYPNDPAAASYDYDEIAATLIYRSQIALTMAWSPNSEYFSRYEGYWNVDGGRSMAYELTGLQPLTAALSVTAGVGYNDLSQILDAGYWYWNIGLSYAMGPLQLDLSRIDSDATAEALFGSTTTEAGWSAAISWHF
jgi:uncharacterized protein (TIGR02001 family)